MGENFFTEPEESPQLGDVSGETISAAPDTLNTDSFEELNEVFGNNSKIGYVGTEEGFEENENILMQSSQASEGGQTTGYEDFMSEQLLQVNDSLNAINEGIGKCNHLVTALLFLVLFQFCYNRIRNAVKYFCGGKDPYE